MFISDIKYSYSLQEESSMQRLVVQNTLPYQQINIHNHSTFHLYFKGKKCFINRISRKGSLVVIFFPFKWFPSLSIFLTVLTVRVCSSAGTWSGLTPSCRPISCGPPPSLHSHSAIQLLNRTTSWMAVAEYNCLPGYRDSGGQVLIYLKELELSSTLVSLCEFS